MAGITSPAIRSVPEDIIPLPSGASTSANQTNGAQKTQIVDSDGTSADVTAHGTTNALAVHTPDLDIVDTMSGLGDSVELTLHGMGSALVQVGGTWQGKIDIQGAIDSIWVTLSIFQPTGQLIRTGINNDAQNGLYRVVIASGYTKIRAVFTTWSSGTASIQIHASTPVGSNQVWQLNPLNLYSTVSQSTASNLNANVTSNGANLATETTLGNINNKLVSGTDIGDVTVNNGAGASAVNIQDGGNAITVDGTVGVSALSTIYNGSKTVPTGTAEAIATTQAIKSVTVKSLSTNTVAVYIGASGVTTSTGIELLADESVTIDIDDLAKVYCISGSASQVVRYIAV